MASRVTTRSSTRGLAKAKTHGAVSGSRRALGSIDANTTRGAGKQPAAQKAKRPFTILVDWRDFRFIHSLDLGNLLNQLGMVLEVECWVA